MGIIFSEATQHTDMGVPFPPPYESDPPKWTRAEQGQTAVGPKRKKKKRMEGTLYLRAKLATEGTSERYRQSIIPTAAE